MRAKGLAKFVCNNEVLLYQGSFSYMYCYYRGNQNSLLYQGLHYIEVHYIKVPLYNETSLYEQILPVPWLFVISRFLSIYLSKGVHLGSKIEVLWGELHSTETKWIV